ncbi:DUF342 domain-containing protein [Bordetella hinzii]|uniref:DUF342 domain-containing protein n=1 Tax=Bordetella hinzii TaxID=103855 RepID=A0AAN1RW63_9BORD|nr:FapA family protein [Bordetella hinzii]AKQ61881.1 hypothetical protein ACR55_04046 [Bordetella hinzii]AZW17184.1 DUF342 domain-containing protein [Bordetella hinzii]MBZ0074794.1 DUF342 domain-containing protein [Bordetella hinzii]MBZ0079546.1 DUF342 domain-containing protein [Bordetella hinzii]MBZ0084239.1 DUF342 domain-containing protein [Bordetella hinzii]
MPPVEEAFRLVLDENTRALIASYTPEGEESEPPSWETLTAAVQAQGWETDVLDQTSAVNFIEACREAGEPVLASVGEVRNGSFELEISPDRMAVVLSVSPPRGGRRVTLADVQAQLIELGVVYGVRDDAILSAVSDRRTNTAVIAQGTPPTLGTPASFESLLDALKTRQQEDDDNAVVDYRELGNLTLVAPGTPLMRRIPAVQGKPGLNVLGEAVPPAHVADTPFAPNLTGVAVDENDPCLLRAASAGSPMVVPQGVLVNSLVEVDRVDLSTGNINFDGTLKVRGDITAGMEVRVSGDVVVNGTVEAAHVHAGGNISVNGGIIGMAELKQTGARGPGNPSQSAQTRTAQITAGGSVKARFIENAVVNADKNIAAEREVRQSRLYAGESVTVGPPKSNQGVITGGEIHATKSVNAGTIGSLAAVPTLICVGLHPHAEAKRAALLQRRNSLQDEKGKLEKLIVFLHNNPARNVNGMSDRARATHARVTGDLNLLQAEEERLDEQLQPLDNATIVALKRFHGGVTLRVSGKVLEIMEERPGGRAMLDAEAGQAVIR